MKINLNSSLIRSKKTRVLSALAALTIAGPAVAAVAYEHSFTADAICQWKDGSLAQATYLSGITNFSTTAGAWIDCGIDAIPTVLTVSGTTVVSTPVPFDLHLNYNDGKVGVTATDAISCALYQCDINNGGSCFAPPVRYSCGTPGGCPGFNNPTWTGTGYIQWGSLAPARTTLDCSLPIVEPTTGFRSFINSIGQVY